MKKSFIITGLLSIVLALPTVAWAHQPRIVKGNPTTVTLPEVSKAYYGILSGEQAVYTIPSDKPFALYVGVLVPDIAGQRKDVSAVVLKDGREIVRLDGSKFAWKRFFEKFGNDTYWQGPEYRGLGEAGTYEIRVTSSNNDSKYALAIGQTEAFNFQESLNALTLIPQIKRDFFNTSPANFFFSPLGFGFIVIMFIIAFVAGFIYRSILKRMAHSQVRVRSKNIGSRDRWIRFSIAGILFVWAITTSWSPWLLFFSGFSFFEAIFSWCGFYAAIGKNSCPIA